MVVPDGVNVSVAPVPMAEPLAQPPSYQVQTDPSEPNVPVTDSVIGAPVQTVAGFDDALIIDEGVATVTIVC